MGDNEDVRSWTSSVSSRGRALRPTVSALLASGFPSSKDTFVRLDALTQKVRKGGRIINADGRPEILAASVDVPRRRRTGAMP
ncbi:hypothetical protein [Nonomuraea sp. NPDC003709]|uniref:hypothetical protein n=1 Tax=Nonomuraea sp. NPDC003709 TaxID=3154450 RepID=UPI0033B09F10